jgi:hypothetical protein
MSHDTFDSDENIEHKSSGTMRIFIFKSEVKPDLRAFGGDLAGIKLPGQFKPWRAVGAIAPNQDPPYKIARDAIEKAIKRMRLSAFSPQKKTKSVSG